MSERFVFVMSVPAGGLEGLVGSKLKASKVLAKAPRAFRAELADFFDEEGLGDPAQLVQEILDGAPQKAHAYEYGRLVELLACALGKRLAVLEVVLTYGLPKGGDGCWNRALKAIGLPLLARHWAADDLHFPFRAPVRRSVSDWPIRTRWSPTLQKSLAAELQSGWRKKLAALDRRVLVEPRDEDFVDDTRAELQRGLLALQRCLKTTVKRGDELVLVMDGSQ
ncbi:MAG: hypothetical protein U0228_15255 [Myxococcaceae bacterium]